MNPAQEKIVAEMQESINDILETAKLVHGENVSRFAFVMSGCNSALRLAEIAAHTPCGSDIHEQAMDDLRDQMVALANCFAAVLGITIEQAEIAKGVMAAVQRNADSNATRLHGAQE
jgi:hypothetical protein